MRKNGRGGVLWVDSVLPPLVAAVELTAPGISLLPTRRPHAAAADAVNGGRLLEAFGAGTAAVVSPVKLVHYDGKDYSIPLDPADPAAGAGPLAKRVWSSLSDIQYGRVPHEWSVKIA